MANVVFLLLQEAPTSELTGIVTAVASAVVSIITIYLKHKSDRNRELETAAKDCEEKLEVTRSECVEEKRSIYVERDEIQTQLNELRVVEANLRAGVSTLTAQLRAADIEPLWTLQN